MKQNLKCGIQQIIFYRNFKTGVFEQIDESENKKERFILSDCIEPERYVWKAGQKKWNLILEDEIENDCFRNIAVYPSFVEPNMVSSSRKDPVVKWQRCIETPAASFMNGIGKNLAAAYKSYFIKKNSVKRALFKIDGSGLKKSIYKYVLKFDWQKKFCSLEEYFTFTEPADEYSKTNALQKGSWFRSYEFSTGKKYADSGWSGTAETVPEKVFFLFQENFLKLRNEYAARELSTSTALKGFPLLDALCSYPYDPNLYVVMTSGLSPAIKIDRNNPECYKQFCKKFGINDFRKLRIDYVKNPMVMFAYKKLTECGFTDINLIMRILESEMCPILYKKEEFYDDEELDEDVSFFIKELVRRRGEKSACNLLLKFIPGWELDDSLRMFKNYRKDIREEVVDKIMHEGFTEYNHDVLSELSQILENDYIAFEYDEAEKSYEWKYDGYEFKLPKDSSELIYIGVKMHNCVASYAREVSEKKTLVIYAEKEERCRICIELNQKEVVQALGLRNAVLADKDLEVLEKWMQKNSLTYDYR